MKQKPKGGEQKINKEGPFEIKFQGKIQLNEKIGNLYPHSNQMNIDIESEKTSKLNFKDLADLNTDPVHLMEKYCGADVNLEELKTDLELSCSFYFVMLRKLKMAVLTNKIQVESQRQTVQQSKAFLQKNIEHEKAARQYLQKQLDHQSEKQSHLKAKKQPCAKGTPKQEIQEENSENSENCEHQCKIRACNKIFKRKQNLYLHQKLKHNTPPHELHLNKIFNIQIKDWSQLSSSKRFK